MRSLQPWIWTHDSRVATGWALIGAAGVAIGTGAYLSRQSDSASSYVLLYPGVAFGIGGLANLLTSSRIEDLSELANQTRDPAAIEQAWLRDARRERKVRHLAGGGLLIASGLTLCLGTYFLVHESQPPDIHATQLFGEAFLWFGAIEGVFGVYALSTHGPIESAFRSYEHTSGRVLWPAEAVLRHTQLGLVPGGAMGTFSTTF